MIYTNHRGRSAAAVSQLLVLIVLVASGCKKSTPTSPPPKPAAVVHTRVQVRPESSGEKVRIHHLDDDGNEISMDVQYLDGSVAVVTYTNGAISLIVETQADRSSTRFDPAASGNTFAKATMLDASGVITSTIEHIGGQTIETTMQDGKPYLRKTALGIDSQCEFIFLRADGSTPLVRFLVNPSTAGAGAQDITFYDAHGKPTAHSLADNQTSMTMVVYRDDGTAHYRQYWTLKNGSNNDHLDEVEELGPDGKSVQKSIEMPPPSISFPAATLSLNPVPQPSASVSADPKQPEIDGAVVRNFNAAGVVIERRYLGPDWIVEHEILFDDSGRKLSDTYPAPQDKVTDGSDRMLVLPVDTPSLDPFLEELEDPSISESPNHFDELYNER